MKDIESIYGTFMEMNHAKECSLIFNGDGTGEVRRIWDSALLCAWPNLEVAGTMITLFMDVNFVDDEPRPVPNWDRESSVARLEK